MNSTEMTTRRAYKRWSQFEINYLHDVLHQLPIAHIAEILGRSADSVQRKCFSIRVNSRSEGYTCRSLARELGAKRGTVQRRVMSGDLKAVRRRSHKRWRSKRGDYYITDEDVATLWTRNPEDIIFSNASEDWLAELPEPKRSRS